jgi:hypothetical protein
MISLNLWLCHTRLLSLPDEPADSCLKGAVSPDEICLKIAWLNRPRWELTTLGSEKVDSPLFFLWVSDFFINSL